ncbi:MAG: lipocalin family protein [Suipraeoptans sp.]
MNNANNKLMLENLKTPVKGLIPALFPEDLLYKPDFDANSWWAGGLFETNGEQLTYVFHLMTVKVPNMGIVFSYRLTFSNVTTGWYYDSGEVACPLSEIKLSEAEFNIEVPNGYIRGNFDHMEIKMRGEKASVDVVMKAMGYPLYNGGDGTFGWQGSLCHQLSIPNMATTGSLVLEGKTYQISGKSWFDRQWQMNNPSSLMSLKWVWMCFELSNKDIISVWTNASGDVENSWATIMHPDGTQTVTYANPLSKGIKEYWRSEASGNCYPVRWNVELPDLDSQFDVVTYPINQEMYSKMQIPGSCYEGISTVKGTYKGQPVSGHTFVEIIGKWEEACLENNAIEKKL